MFLPMSRLKGGYFATASSGRVLFPPSASKGTRSPPWGVGPGVPLPAPWELRSCAVICWGDWVKTSPDPLEEQKAKIALSKLKLSTTE